ncbi:MAG: glutaredoxin domain-containing protein [Solirubrobacteraceae bacterium]
MKNVTVYTTTMCPYCTGAKALLDKRGVTYEEINLSRDPDGRTKLREATGMITFPQVLIDGQSIGGFTELRAADHSGALPTLLAD